MRYFWQLDPFITFFFFLNMSIATAFQGANKALAIETRLAVLATIN